MRGWTIRLFLIGLPVVLSSRTEAADYYVSPSGSDVGSGLGSENAWRTIAHAARNARAGDTIHIQGGRYRNDRLLVEQTATRDRPIVFEGCDGIPELSNSDGKGIHVLNSQHVRIANIAVTNCADNGVRLDNSHYCTLANIHVRDCHNRGQVCYVRDSDHNILQNCTIHQTTVDADYYLVLVYSHHNTVRDCRSVHAAGFAAGHQTHGIGIKDYTGDDPAPEHHSHHNTFIDCTAVNHGECFYAARPCHDNRFINCFADNSGGKQSFNPCFQVRDGAYDNTFLNCRAIGTKVGACVYDYSEKDNTGSEYQRQVNNRFINCVIEGADDEMIGVFLRRAEGTLLRNCVFRKCGYLYRFGCDGATGRAEGVVGTEMRNCIVMDCRWKCDRRSLGEPYRHDEGVAAYEGAVKVTHSDFFRNGFRPPRGEANIEADPMLDDRQHLAPGSPCIDAGTNEGVMDGDKDFEGDPRRINGTVDIGADEHCGQR